jgi:cell wall-associated NlpC family hydrolase
MAELGIDIQFNGIGNSTTGKIMSSDNGMCCLIDEEKSVQEKCGFVLKNAEIGDVLLFHRQSVKSKMVEKDNWYPGHVGIYIGDGKYIDARHRRGDVRVVDINNDEYMNCFIGFKRFIFEKTFEPEVLKMISKALNN